MQLALNQSFHDNININPFRIRHNEKQQNNDNVAHGNIVPGVTDADTWKVIS